jgi:hypothetical protein
MPAIGKLVKKPFRCLAVAAMHAHPAATDVVMAVAMPAVAADAAMVAADCSVGAAVVVAADAVVVTPVAATAAASLKPMLAASRPLKFVNAAFGFRTW